MSRTTSEASSGMFFKKPRIWGSPHATWAFKVVRTILLSSLLVFLVMKFPYNRHLLDALSLSTAPKDSAQVLMEQYSKATSADQQPAASELQTTQAPDEPVGMDKFPDSPRDEKQQELSHRKEMLARHMLQLRRSRERMTLSEQSEHNSDGEGQEVKTEAGLANTVDGGMTGNPQQQEVEGEGEGELASGTQTTSPPEQVTEEPQSPASKNLVFDKKTLAETLKMLRTKGVRKIKQQRVSETLENPAQNTQEEQWKPVNPVHDIVSGSQDTQQQVPIEQEAEHFSSSENQQMEKSQLDQLQNYVNKMQQEQLTAFNSQNEQQDVNMGNPDTGSQGSISPNSQQVATSDSLDSGSTINTLENTEETNTQNEVLQPLNNVVYEPSLEQSARQCTNDERVQHYHKVCTNSHLTYDTSVFSDARNFARFFVLKQERVIYCGLQQTETKTWREIIEDALELVPGESYNPQSVAHGQIIKDKGIFYLSEHTLKDIQELLQDPSYRKVLILKHPLSRVMSAYQFRVKNGPLWRLKKLKASLTEVHGENVEGFNISLRQFIKHVVNEDPRQADRYWQTYQNLCYPCLINFDEVIKGETTSLAADTLSEDGQQLPQPPIGDKSLKKFSFLPANLMGKLLKHYETDMAMFGYEWDSSNSKAVCRQPSQSQQYTECC